jgi:tetraprenyl-beta-curcumene synthase
MAMPGDRQLNLQATLALGVANGRYWPTVWPVLQAELRRWERRAEAIEDPELRTLALEKLHDERFNAEVAGTLATLAPRVQRRSVIEAIVALEVLYDYLDGLTERPSPDPLADGDALFAAFMDAIDMSARVVDGEYFRHRPGRGDGGYLDDLSAATRAALGRLPARVAVAEVAQRTAARCSQAQVHIHAAAQLGDEQLEAWAQREAQGTGLGWRELLAGSASSVLAIHALIAAAAGPRTTPEDASAIEATYLSICVLITVLDSLVDWQADTIANQPSFIRFYEDREQLAETLASATRRAVGQAAALADGPHHVMTLAGIVAYYASAPGARSDLASPVAARLRHELAPVIHPALAVMRSWRLAKRARRRWLRSGGPRVAGD